LNPYYDLGSYSRPISTASAKAQTWFDRGLIWCYAYNHEESVRCFENAAKLDENCAMAYWGIAYATGCNYNRTWQDFGQKELQNVVSTCRQNSQKALTRLNNTTETEKALIQALEKRYQSKDIVSDDEFCAWNDDYANAMRDVYQRFPNDLDVATLFTEALINRTPWKLWDLKTGKAAKDASTTEAINITEKALKQLEDEQLEPHAGLLHMYIHLMEMSCTCPHTSISCVVSTTTPSQQTNAPLLLTINT